MAKQYKPGQFVWINGKKHRVTKTATFKYPCKCCPYRYDYTTCIDLERICFSLPDDCYPKPV